MLKTLVAIALVMAASAPSIASDQADAVSTVRKFVESFNKGDVQGAVSTCADETTIIDEFPPYEWHGPGACAAWTDAYEADARKNGITGGVVTLGKMRHADISGDRAYIVTGVNYVYRMKGKTVREIGSTLTVALKKGESGYRIVAWTWSKR